MGRKRNANGKQPIHYVHNDDFLNQDIMKDALGNMPNIKEYEEKQRKASTPTSTPELKICYMTPLLSREQELFLFRKMNYLRYLAANEEKRTGNSDSATIRNLLNKASEVQNTLVIANYRLLVNRAKKLTFKEPHELFNAVSDGVLPLMNAVKNFDYSRGAKFSTYATNAILRGRYDHRRRRNKPLVTSISDSTIDKPFIDTSINSIDDRECAKIIKKAIDKLAPRDRMILNMRIGLGPLSPNGKDVWTLSQIGKKMKITKERVRQIATDSIKKVREYVGSKNDG